MFKGRNNSQGKLPNMQNFIMYDGKETKFNKRIFKEYQYDKINMFWEGKPITKQNDFDFQKVNNVSQDEMNCHIKESYQLPQVFKRRNSLYNECFAVSPQITEDNEFKFGKYVKRYTQDSDIFQTKKQPKTIVSLNSSSYGSFYYKPEYQFTKTKPVLTYHTSKSQILGHKRLENIKLKQELC